MSRTGSVVLTVLIAVVALCIGGGTVYTLDHRAPSGSAVADQPTPHVVAPEEPGTPSATASASPTLVSEDELDDRLPTITAPAACARPAGALVAGQLPVVDPIHNGETAVATLQDGTPIAAVAGADSAVPGLAAVAFGCNAGGVSWPDVIGFYDSSLQLVGSYDLADDTEQEHSFVSTMTFGAGMLLITWTSYDGAGECVHHHSGNLTLDHGTVTLSGETSTLDLGAMCSDPSAVEG